MRVFSLKSLLISACGALAFIPAGQSIAAPAVQSKWLQTFTETPEGGFIVGNPNAAKQLVEYASYTCGHCATFEANDVPQLKSQHVSNGSVSFEIRSLVRDPVDLTVAMLARCGGKARFFGNHKFLMANQTAIGKKTPLIKESSKNFLKSKDITGFMQAAYIDMGLAPLMAKRGITNAQAKQCLSDNSTLNKLLALGEGATNKYNIKGTPSFLLNGKLVDRAHNFAELSTLLNK
jgi:protein-disulfide isomerase